MSGTAALATPVAEWQNVAMSSAIMKFFGLLVVGSIVASAAAQTPDPAGASGSQLEVLTRKIDEQNTKIDALSQQLLKLEQQISNIRPGVMIGEPTPSAGTSPTAVTGAVQTDPVKAGAAGNSHVVTRGETLTSIAKTHKVGVEELQKFNHIENDRKLQAGQTIMIPGSSASPSASAAATSPSE